MKITLSERSSSYFPIRIDLEDSLGNVTNGTNGKITATTNSSMNHSSLMSFIYPDVAFNESNVDKTIIKKECILIQALQIFLPPFLLIIWQLAIQQG